MSEAVIQGSSNMICAPKISASLLGMSVFCRAFTTAKNRYFDNRAGNRCQLNKAMKMPDLEGLARTRICDDFWLDQRSDQHLARMVSENVLGDEVDIAQ